MSLSVVGMGNYSSEYAAENTIAHQPADEPIRIRNNAGLAALASSGIGTENDPYFIANLQLAVTDEEVALDISHTNAHFILKNCRIVVVQGFFAILLWNVSNCVIEDCEILGGGLSFDGSNSCEIVDSTISGPLGESAIDLLFCRDVMILRNTIFDSSTGIALYGSENIWISSNYISDNTYGGIEIYLTGNITMHDNILENNGVLLSLWGGIGGMDFSLEGSQYIDVPYNFANNTINGKPLGFFHEEMDSIVSGDIYGQVILLNCTNVDVIGGIFSNASVGFQVYYSRNCSIESSTLVNNTSHGLQIFQSEFGQVSACTVIDNGGTGVFIENSNYTLVEGNAIIDNDESGVHLYSSDECRISNNTLMGNSRGIGFYASTSCSVIDNVIIYNSLNGVSIDSQSRQNIIYRNYIGWNAGRNGFDNSGYNLWDNGVDTGNMWSDYSGFGVYEVDYYGVDHYPTFLGNPFLNPAVLTIIGIVSGALIIIILVIIWFRRRT